MTEHDIIKKELANSHIEDAVILKARKAFNEKEFKLCLDLYDSIKQKTLLNPLDHKIIEYCKQQV